MSILWEKAKRYNSTKAGMCISHRSMFNTQMTQLQAKRIQPVPVGNVKKFRQLGHNGKQKASLFLPLGQLIHLLSFWWAFKWFPSFSFHFSIMNIFRYVSWCACEWFLIHMKGDCWFSERVNFQLYKIMSNCFSKGYPKSHMFLDKEKWQCWRPSVFQWSPTHLCISFISSPPLLSPLLESWNISGRGTLKNVQLKPLAERKLRFREDKVACSTSDS